VITFDFVDNIFSNHVSCIFVVNCLYIIFSVAMATVIVRTQDGSNQTLKLVFAASPLSTQH